MENAPLVSVVMPVYNGEKYLDDAVTSILDQSFRDFEFIIINDGSTDSTSAILRRYQDEDERVCVHHQENLGLITALNRGCRLAKGKYIARMDSDDISLPERLAKQMDHMKAHPDIGVLGTWIEYIYECGEVRSHWRMPTTPGLIGWSLIFGTCVAHPTVMMRSDLLKRLNYYRPEALHVEDYDLWTRASFIISIANLPEVLLKRRTWKGSICSRHSQTQEENLLEVMRSVIERLLGTEVPAESVACLRQTAINPSLASLGQIAAAADLTERLCRAYMRANSMSPSEVKAVAQDAAKKIYILAKWANKISFWKYLLITAKAFRLKPSASSLLLLVKRA